MRDNFPALGVCLLFCLWMEKNPQALMEGFGILEFYIYINLLTMLLFPNGLYKTELYTENWFLGYKNIQIRTILPIVCISLIQSYRTYGRISARTKILMACSIVTFLLCDSATALVGFVVFIGLLFLFHRKKKRLPRIVTLMNGVIAVIVLFFMIVVFGYLRPFAYLIERVLDRTLTFTSRTIIWDRTLALLKGKLLIAYGYLSNNDYVNLLGNAHFTHPHNYFLYVAMSGGIILLAILFWGYYMAHKKLKATSDTVYSKIILFCLLSFMVMGLTEAITSTVLLYPMLILAMKSDRLTPVESQMAEKRVSGRRIVLKKRIVFKIH